MNRNCTLLFFLLLFVVRVSAHEYWLEPESFFLKPNEKAAVRLFLGEGLKKEEERPFQMSKTTMFKLFSADGDFDLISSGRDEEMPLFTFASERSGNYLLGLERNWSYITLEPEKFDEYLREDGLEYILAERERLGESKKEGRERYSRYIKGLMQVGDKRDKTFAKRIGLKLEIVPLENPYSKKAGEELSFQVLFQGKPLKDKTIFADNRDGEAISKQKLKTDAQGKTTVKLDRKGIWLVRLVYMQRCPKDCEGADWESFWSAFSFGVK
ncbi:MAG TPA: DUF4198 domain-containing protein [Pyrinomonadaceae bacterium]|nr:DUF4198 domain-containing protein [Pyrinomonadaceae bacterium]